MMYHTYAHYMLIREKLKYNIYSENLFVEYKQNMSALQNKMISENFEKSRKHFNTELVFCAVCHIKT